MAWIDRVILIASVLAVVLTLRHLAATIASARPAPSAPAPPSSPEIGSGVAAAPVRIWADDVLAEEEMKERKTQGAAPHSSDVCAWWDEEDERQASAEASARILRSLRSP